VLGQATAEFGDGLHRHVNLKHNALFASPFRPGEIERANHSRLHKDTTVGRTDERQLSFSADALIGATRRKPRLGCDPDIE